MFCRLVFVLAVVFFQLLVFGILLVLNLVLFFLTCSGRFPTSGSDPPLLLVLNLILATSLLLVLSLILATTLLLVLNLGTSF